MPRPDVVFGAVLLGEALDVGLGHLIDKVHLPGAQRRQAHRVFTFRLGDKFLPR